MRPGDGGFGGRWAGGDVGLTGGTGFAGCGWYPPGWCCPKGGRSGSWPGFEGSAPQTKRLTTSKRASSRPIADECLCYNVYDTSAIVGSGRNGRNQARRRPCVRHVHGRRDLGFQRNGNAPVGVEDDTGDIGDVSTIPKVGNTDEQAPQLHADPLALQEIPDPTVGQDYGL